MPVFGDKDAQSGRPSGARFEHEGSLVDRLMAASRLHRHDSEIQLDDCPALSIRRRDERLGDRPETSAGRSPGFSQCGFGTPLKECRSSRQDRQPRCWQSAAMGISFDRDVRIAGYRISVFRDALKRYSGTQGLAGLVDLRSIFALRRDGAIVYEELLDCGLIDETNGTVTAAGEVLIRSKVVPRTPLRKAEVVLDAFLERVHENNNNPEAISRIDEVWLYGSMLRREAAVGDIDLAITRSTSPRFRDLDDRIGQADRLLADLPGSPQSWSMEWDKIDWVFHRAIYGSRRHALLAGAKEGVEDLIALATPCKLIYDRERGGRVADDVLPRHPRSNGRADTVDPLPEIPDLTPRPLRPMDARWVAGYDRRGEIWPYHIFRGWTDECHRLFPDQPHHLRVAHFGGDLPGFPWIPPAATRPDVDGRAAIVIVHATEASGFSITLRRSFAAREDEIVLAADICDLETRRPRKHVDPVAVSEVVAAISLILAVDAERALRRALGQGAFEEIVIRVTAGGPAEGLVSRIRNGVLSTLSNRLIAIEPDGSPVSVRIVEGPEVHEHTSAE